MIVNSITLPGGRFNPKGRRVPLLNDTDINEVVSVNHWEILGVMNFRLSTGKTAWDYLDYSLQ